MLDWLAAVLIGVIGGTFTGLLPGVHVNLVCTLLLASAAALSRFFDGIELALFIISMSVAQSFLDPLPAIFLGAPEADTGLGVLPGHRYLLRGLGLMAVKLTVLGCLGGLLLSLLLFPAFLLLVRVGYPLLLRTMGGVLLVLAAFMILRDRKPVLAAGIFLLSGLLGLATFRLWFIENPLFPLLSGLFGISTLLFSLNDSARIPPQQARNDIAFDNTRAGHALVGGVASGFLTAVLPGLGAGLAAILTLQVVRDLRDHGFMILLGAISSANFVLSLVALLALDKARNGAVLAIQTLFEVQAPHIALFMAAALAAGGLGAIVSLRLGAVFAAWIGRLDYPRLVACVIGFIAVLCAVLTGWAGMLVLLASTAVGLLPAILKVGRVQAMGVILLPVITYFL